MIKEDYCSYEVAKLLKEKGFDWAVLTCYENSEFRYVNLWNWNKFSASTLCSAPTHQMAMKWLREEHNIDIIPVIRHSLKYAQENPFRDYACRVYDADGNIVMSTTKWYSKYERAVEAALKYALENLI